MKTLATAGITCAVTLLIAVPVCIGLTRRHKEDRGAAVRVEKPIRGDLVEVVSASGTIMPKTKVSISARVSALIQEIPHDEGAQVTRGDLSATPPRPPSVLVRLDDKDLQAALRTAESTRESKAAQIEVARARLVAERNTIDGMRVSLEDARRTLQRQTKLLVDSYASQKDRDTAQCAVDLLVANIASSEATLKADELNLVVMQHDLAAADAAVAGAKDNLSYTVITSPIDGVVTAVKAKAGEMAVTGTMNNPGTEILQVADLSKMELLAEVDEVYIGKVQPGQKAKVTVQAYPNRTFEGTVESIALVNSTNTRTGSKYFETRILVNGEGRQLLSGLTGEADIEVMRHKGVVKVPTQAVLGRRTDELPAKISDKNANVQSDKTETPVVYRLIDGKAVVTPVKIGFADATHTQVVSGLADDDRVIVGPYKVLEKLQNEQHVYDDRSASPAQGAAAQTTAKPS
jgi:HlyD family secretion protein